MRLSFIFPFWAENSISNETDNWPAQLCFITKRKNSHWRNKNELCWMRQKIKKKKEIHKSKCLNTTTQYTHIHAHTCFVAHSEAVFLNSSVCLYNFFYSIYSLMNPCFAHSLISLLLCLFHIKIVGEKKSNTNEMYKKTI